MFGSGGGALIAKALGEQNRKKADSLFSTVYVLAIGLGITLSLLGQLTLPYTVRLLGAEGEMMTQGMQYARITLMFIPAVMLQYVNQYMLPTAEKARLGMSITIFAGVVNILLVVLFVAVFRWGVTGAAMANGIGQCMGGFLPLFWFASKKNDGLLHFIKPEFHMREIVQMSVNGSSEFVTNLSSYLIGILFNFQLMRFIGEDGVAIFGVIMYINMIFISVFTGYSIGVGPVVGYNNGAGNHLELKNILKKSLVMIGGSGVILMALAMLLSSPLAFLYVGYDEILWDSTTIAFRIYSSSFLIMGMNIFGSAFFTSLNNGLISALISFLRTLLFQACAVMLLPVFFGETGIWFSVFAAEALTLIVTVVCLITNKNKYHYFA